MLTPLDIALILFTLLLIARGAWTGFVRQIALPVALVLGFAAAGHYFKPFSQVVQPFINAPQPAFIVTYILLFVLAYLFTLSMGLGLKKVMEISLLSWFDRTMGAILGFAKAGLVIILLFLLTVSVMSSPPKIVSRSFFFPWVEKGAANFLLLIRDPNIRQHLLPKKPAIPLLPPATKK